MMSAALLRRVRLIGHSEAHASLPASLVEGDSLDATSFNCAEPGADERTAIVDDLRTRAAFTRQPSQTKLPVSYRVVPAGLRMKLARLIGRRQRGRIDRWAAYPGFPLDLSADVAADLLGVPTQRTEPHEPTPVVLSHDLDSPEGVSNFLSMFAPMEEAAGARSTNYIVPCDWPIDHGQVGELVQRGHELGIHGHDHAGRTPFADDATRRQRLEAARPLIERYGCKGYRAPSLMRSPPLLRALAGLYAYDSSVPTSGGLFPVPNNGCASARPFELEGIAELPLSMPRDGSMRFLGDTPDRIADTWLACAGRIAAMRGVVVLLTHCERHFSGNEPMLAAYRRFVETVAGDDRYCFATGAEVMQS